MIQHIMYRATNNIGNQSAWQYRKHLIQRYCKKRFLLICCLVFLLPILLFGQWRPAMRLTENDSISRTSTNNARCIAAYGSVVHVVWHDYRFGGPQIFFKRSIDWGNTWQGDYRLTSSSGFPVDPSIAVWGYNIHVVWQDNYAGNSEIYYKCSTDHGVSWEDNTRLTYCEAISGWPSIAVSDNDIHIMWYDFRTGYPRDLL